MRTLALAMLLLLPQEDVRLRLQRGPYLQNVRPDGAVVCFWTTAECEGTVRVGGQVVRTPRGTRHYAEVTGLTPATEYRYTVEAGGVKSDEIPFRTAPGPDAAVTFVAYGDTRSNHEAHAKVVELILKQKPDFVLHSGDLVDDGRKSDQWDKFFEIVAPVVRTAPLYPAIGNHEANAKEYFDIFVLPHEERWYSVDWGPVHFVSIDTTFLYRKNPKQLEWLKDDLAKSKAPFKIVFWHHAPYACSTRKERQAESKLLAEIYGPILEAGGVQLAIGGHNHNYQRAEVNGVCYVTSAGGGAPLYDIGEGTELKASRKAYHVCRLRADGKTLTLEAIDLENRVFDTWSVSR